MITQWVLAKGCSVPRMTHFFGDDSLPYRGGWEVRGSPYPGENSFFVLPEEKHLDDEQADLGAVSGWATPVKLSYTPS